jgi:hypothetical protein
MPLGHFSLSFKRTQFGVAGSNTLNTAVSVTGLSKSRHVRWNICHYGLGFNWSQCLLQFMCSSSTRKCECNLPPAADGRNYLQSGTKSYRRQDRLAYWSVPAPKSGPTIFCLPNLLLSCGWYCNINIFIHNFKYC